MSFARFAYDEAQIPELFERAGRSDREVLVGLREGLDDTALPEYVLNYLLQETRGDSKAVSFHKPSGFGTAASKYSEDEKNTIRRTRGIFATNEYRRSERPEARHHLKVFFNDVGMARLFYKIRSGPVKFIQNRR